MHRTVRRDELPANMALMVESSVRTVVHAPDCVAGHWCRQPGGVAAEKYRRQGCREVRDYEDICLVLFFFFFCSSAAQADREGCHAGDRQCLM